MPSFTWKEKLVLMKKEATYGVDSTPTAAVNAIRTLNAQITPIEGDEVVLDVDNPALGAPEAALAGQHVSGSFDVALSGSGTAGTAPGWGAVLRACGFAETVVATTSTTYTPINTGHESFTLYFQMKGALHKVLGLRGKASIKASAKDWLLLSINFRGLYVPVAAAPGSLPAATYSAAPELLVNDANTDFLLDALAAPMSEFTLDMGSDAEALMLVGQESIELPDPVPTGSTTILDPGVATKDYFALAAARTKVAAKLTHGTVAGNIVEVEGASVQLGPKLTYTEVQGRRGLQVPLRFCAAPIGPLTITVK